MAATGKTPILLYGSTTATNVPVAGNLTNSSDGCEIAINVADKNLFFKDSTNAVNTVPIRQSSGSSDGWLSSANWTTFNSKQTAYTNLTTIGSLANAAGWLYNNGSGTFSYSTPTASDVGAVPTTRTISTTSPLAGGGDLSANRTLSITQATTSTNGYLSSTDWNTFNNKQPAGSYALTTGTLAQFASTTSAQLAGVISDETGTGALVFATSPSFTTPSLGAATATTINSVKIDQKGASSVGIYGALANLSTGTACVGMGLLAGDAMTTTTANSYYGYVTGRYATGNNNTFLGAYAGTNVTTGDGNTVVGRAALNGVSGTTATTSNNTAIGNAAGYSINSGSSNIYIGQSSGYYITTGGSNVILGSFNGNAGGLDIRTSSNYLVLADGAGNLRAYNDATNWTIPSGNVNLSNGNLVIGTSGKGIDFSATAGTGTSELLADYEEGSFTPVFRDGVSGTAATTSSSKGYYTKTGNRVDYTIELVNINTTGLTAANQFFITGLPYTATSLTSTYWPGSCFLSSVTATTGAVAPVVIQGTTVVACQNMTTTGNTGMLVSAVSSGAGDIYINGSYQAA